MKMERGRPDRLVSFPHEIGPNLSPFVIWTMQLFPFHRRQWCELVNKFQFYLKFNLIYSTRHLFSTMQWGVPPMRLVSFSFFFHLLFIRHFRAEKLCNSLRKLVSIEINWRITSHRLRREYIETIVVVIKMRKLSEPCASTNRYNVHCAWWNASATARMHRIMSRINAEN